MDTIFGKKGTFPFSLCDVIVCLHFYRAVASMRRTEALASINIFSLTSFFKFSCPWVLIVRYTAAFDDKAAFIVVIMFCTAGWPFSSSLSAVLKQLISSLDSNFSFE